MTDLRLFRLAVPAVALLVLPSCGPSGPTLYPVTGKVFFDGKPAEGATVVFQPVNPTPDSPTPGGLVGADGTYTLNTYPHGPGAPAGDYNVVFTWYVDAAAGKKAQTVDGDAKSVLPLRYSDPTKSGIKATVKPGENTLEPFQLTRR